MYKAHIYYSYGTQTQVDKTCLVPIFGVGKSILQSIH